MKAGRRISLALALSLILFLPVAYAGSTITLTSPNPQTNGQFGYSVAVNEGDPLVVIGAPRETATYTGMAYVLDTATGLFTPLTNHNTQTLGGFGWSVAISGTTVVVGDPFVTVDTSVYAGHAYVFDATDGSLIATLTSPNPVKYKEFFGWSVAISGTTVVVGEPGDIGGSSGAGHAYVFSATDGSLITTLSTPSTAGSFSFGTSVAISCDTVVVGAPYEEVGTQFLVGHAYVFSATDGSLITTLSSLNEQQDGLFGWSVSISGTTVVAGAPGEKVGTAQSGAGHAYVFDVSTSVPTSTTLTSPYALAGGHFGLSVAVGGTTVVVGAPDEIVGLLAKAGHAYSFDASTGFVTITLTSSNPQTNGEFGSSVASGGTTVVVGAPTESGGGSSGAGHAYIFS